MIYQIYVDDNELKYSDPSFTKIKNTAENRDLYGEIAQYQNILDDAKKNNYKNIGIYQARRHLSYKEDKPLLEANIPEKLFEEYKVFHTYYFVNGSNYLLWINSHRMVAALLESTVNLVCKLYPDYSRTCEIFLNGNLLFPHNMFIMSTVEFEKYYNWLMTIFRHIQFADTGKIQKPYSLLAERLFTIWCLQNYSNKEQVFINAVAYDKNDGRMIDNVHAVID